MTKLVAGAALFMAVTLAGPTVVLSSATGPGPNGHNTFGLCNAYGNGSSTGQAEKQAHGAAFLGLEATATAWDAQQDQSNGPGSSDEGTTADSSESTQQKVAEYCAADGTQP